MFTDTRQSQATFTFAIDPKIPVSGPAGNIDNVTCAVGLSIAAAPVVTASAGSGSAQLSAGMSGYRALAEPHAPAGAFTFGPSPAQMLGPQPLGSSQAKMTISYTAPTVLLCAINISAVPQGPGIVLPAKGSLSLPLDTTAVEIVMTDWTLTRAPRAGFILLTPSQLRATLAVTANGTTQTVNVG